MHSWHQRAATRRAYRLRRYKAHIQGADWLRDGKGLCGRPTVVWIDNMAALDRPENNVCAACRRAYRTERKGHNR